MTCKRWQVVAGFLIAAAMAVSASAQELPTDIAPLDAAARARLKQRDEALKKVAEVPKDLRFFADRTKTWSPGAVVRVAFQGGDSDLHREIAELSRAWTEHANLVLDFGEKNGTYRTWSTEDEVYRAEIRITFEGDGAKSYIGTDATDPAVVGPGEPSLWLGGYDTNRPWYWQSTVVHELGHAIGLLHEHQRPDANCDAQYRWKDEGDKPGIYTILARPPWKWTQEMVDTNFRELPDSDAYQIPGPFDDESIMRYPMQDWMFYDGENSSCYWGQRNVKLSEADERGIADLYPSGASAQRQDLEKRRASYEVLVRSTGELSEDQRWVYGARLAEVEGLLAGLDGGS